MVTYIKFFYHLLKILIDNFIFEFLISYD